MENKSLLIGDICVLVPVFNDWECLNAFLAQVKSVLNEKVRNGYRIVAVNDGSSSLHKNEISHDEKLTLLHLNRNVGHQKAIAIGLAYVQDIINPHMTIVMDVDGEDNPEDIPVLLEKAEKSGCVNIVFAKRSKRKEKFSFKFFYFFYKIVFRVITGGKISFGNYSVIPACLLKKIVYLPEVGVHFSGAIMNANLPYELVSCNREKRYFGKSKMNLSRLVLHGLASISVNIDAVATRLLLFSLLSIVLIFIGIIFILGIKIFTNLAIPGWTSNIIFLMLILGIEIFILCVFLVFQILFHKNKFNEFIPAQHYKTFLISPNIS